MKDKTFKTEDILPMYQTSDRVARTTIAMIDAVVQRGAIKGEELSAIGQLRDSAVKLVQLCENFHSEMEEED
jgi:hypothetical protein